MAETTNLKLYKADPAVDGEKTFNIDKMLNENWDKIDEAVKDAFEHGVPHLGITTNNGNDYSIDTAETISVNQKFTVKFNAASAGPATLNVSTIGSARSIKKPGGADANLKVGVYTLFWDGAVFQLLGEGGEFGTATASKVLAGTTFGTDNGLASGVAAPKVVNLAADGSFESGLEAWTVRGKGITTGEQPGVAKIGTKYIQFMTQFDYAADIIQTVPVIKGHKYYASAWYQASGFTGTYEGVGQIDIIGLPTGEEIDFIEFSKKFVPADSQWHFMSGVAEGLETGDFILRAYTHNMSMSYLDGVMLIDLTTAFGEGNEPDKTTMDAIVQANGGFWDTGLEFVDGKGLGVDPEKILSGYKFIGANGYTMAGTMKDFSGYPLQDRNYARARSAKGDTGGSLVVEPDEAGFYAPGLNSGGFGTIIAYNPDYIPDNIRHGKTIFGVVGSYKPYPNINPGARTLHSLSTSSTKSVYSLEFTTVFRYDMKIPGGYRLRTDFRSNFSGRLVQMRSRYVDNKGNQTIINVADWSNNSTTPVFSDITVSDDLGSIYIDLRVTDGPNPNYNSAQLTFVALYTDYDADHYFCDTTQYTT